MGRGGVVQQDMGTRLLFILVFFVHLGQPRQARQGGLGEARVHAAPPLPTCFGRGLTGWWDPVVPTPHLQSKQQTPPVAYRRLPTDAPCVLGGRGLAVL